MGEFHDEISRFPIPAIAGLASRLAEIGVRTIFMVLASVATLLFEELEKRVDDQVDNLIAFNDKIQRSTFLDQWKTEYGLVVKFIDHFNRCFGCILLFISTIDFIVSVTDVTKYS